MRPPVPADPARPRTSRARRAISALIVIGAVAYAAAIARLMTQETELIFHTELARADTKPPFAYEQVDLPRADGARQFAWRMEREQPGSDGDTGVTWVLFLPGNASTVASRV